MQYIMGKNGLCSRHALFIIIYYVNKEFNTNFIYSQIYVRGTYDNFKLFPYNKKKLGL